MELSLDQIMSAIGVIGAYFAVLLVLAVAVEAILDLIKLGGLLRERISPEQVMKDVAEWLPQNQQAQAKVAAITHLVSQYQVKSEEVERELAALRSLSTETAAALGLGAAASESEKRLAVALHALRKKYTADEAKRVAILRAVSAALGIAIAVALRINTFDLLGPLLPESLAGVIQSDAARWGGMLLTGFGASAGSSFWHDKLDKVRAVKESVRKVKEEFAP